MYIYFKRFMTMIIIISTCGFEIFLRSINRYLRSTSTLCYLLNYLPKFVISVLFLRSFGRDYRYLIKC